ncbi:MAG: amidohydrolase [Planctomycetota bacterium]|nr:MAG: amidohydrolase [Planctomycetota bacterium]
MKAWLFLCLFGFAAPLAGQNSGSQAAAADQVWLSGRIYTMDPAQPWAEAMAVQAGELMAVGQNQDVSAWIGPQTKVHDLQNHLVLPGLHDVHSHFLEAFHTAWTCYLPPGWSPEDYIPLIRFCAWFQLGTHWVLGYGYRFEDMVRHLAAGGRSPVEILDDAVPNRPALMLEETSHSVWVNSAALQALGFHAGSQDPPGGRILRNPVTGEPNGLLLDGAGEMAQDLAFQPNPALMDLNVQALRNGLKELAKNGITSACDARAHWRRGFLEAYDQAETEGWLSARVNLGLWVYPYLQDDSQITQLKSFYRSNPGALLQRSQIKIYADGEVGHTTAAVLQNYITPVHFADPDGLNYYNKDRLQHFITELEVEGFDFHIHTIGNRGVREALDAIAGAAAANGPMDRRHRLTHCELIHPADLPRFVQLGVTGDFQMSSHYVRNTSALQRWYDFFLGLGTGAREAFRLRDLWDSGANVVLSSDYDVGPMSPFVGMENALLRTDQALPDLAAAIRAYTVNPAWLMRQEHLVGSLEVSKRADFVVLDRDLFQIPVSEIGETQVLVTVVDGRVVYLKP